MAKLLGSMLSKFADIALKSRIRDDDPIDQLNHWATTGLLAALAVGSAAKQYVGDPIRCWVPAQYKKKYYQKYSDSYCWIHPMYNIPFDDMLPFEEEDRWNTDVSFYRWVFIVFLLQAALFKFPNIVWNELKMYSGLNVKKIVSMAWETNMMTQEKRDETMSHIAIFVDRWLKTYSEYKYNAITRFRNKFSTIVFCFGKRTGTYLSGLYMFTKLLYFANIIGQFFLLSAFLDVNFWNFGIDAVGVLFKKGRWENLYIFPRIAMCDYKIRQLQNVQTYTVQCVLSLNLFLEKMYLILWFWLILLLILNSINLGIWIYRGLAPHRGEAFLSKYLQLMGIDSKRERKVFAKFVRGYLKTDGVFMLRIVAGNTSEILTLDLVKQLWERFKISNPELVSPDRVRETPNGRKPSAPTLEGDEDELPPKPDH